MELKEHRPTPEKTARQGFTLLELLLVLAVVALLASLFLPALVRAKERARRISCLNNLRQLLTVSLIYADEHDKGSFTTDTRGRPGQRLDVDDDLSHFFPAGIPSPRTFLCPSTRNFIRPDVYWHDPLTGAAYLRDLAQYDHSPEDPGMSYECFGVMGWTQRKTINSVNTYRHRQTTFALQGQTPGPAQIWLVLDGQRGRNDLSSGNHGTAGANVGFCDGRAAWIPAREWELAYELSQDEGDGRFPDHLRVGTY